MRAADRNLKIALGALAVAAVSGVLVCSTVGGPGLMGFGMMRGYGSPGGWAAGPGPVAGMLAMLLFWTALIVGLTLLIRWLLRQPAGSADQPAAADDPLLILRRRYAAGEIDRDTFEQMDRELNREVVRR
jgi:putative membrane protein